MARSIILLMLVAILSACVQPQILVTGNVENICSIEDGGNLAELLKQHEITAEYVLFIAADGTAFLTSEKSFSALEFSKKKRKFYSHSALLPPVCNLHDVREICVFRTDYSQSGKQNEQFYQRLTDFQKLGESSQNGYSVRKYKLREK
ncbi:MAG TPA: hypothetical protein PLD62_07935 [Candidatus Cloacimonadota bacterium]|nr:hypothetical protein [Candidatus Cloacimonadota bacterium]